MSEPTPREKPEASLADRIGAKAKRKRRARRGEQRSAWRGLRVSGLVGWSVALPTLLGTALGVWLDARHAAGGRSWTLALLVLGLALGCFNAWRWVAQEAEDMEREEGRDDE